MFALLFAVATNSDIHAPQISTHAQVSSFNRVGNTPRFREVNVGA